ncbi:hypothetical protein JDV02_002129 [Purpureocillium takamizusanense]|uniref:Mitochondrial thiamine pyrophosphate carrier 1 n=1 Tax=Purpureocillium takamizusanense TaxID=2060973 RepID=A0A9Q8Q9P6_9HYPO|nr:uncharacterized protein JDV02_002129 [Purpureocillium takamizusanense]UNI15610.1 hypothetical protein JDV02_002129 [Purpureocillium takamizusanense]
MSAVRGPQLQPASPAVTPAAMPPEPDVISEPAKAPEKFVALRERVSQPVIAAFCAGGVAGAVSRTVVSPLERLKILMQIQSVGRDAYKLSVGQALAKMWREEGWRGFMRGNGTNCIRIVPYSAVQFSSYNFYKRNIFEPYPGADLAPLTRLVCGGVAGITSVFFTYPLDIVRTRLSIQSASFAELGDKPKQLPGMWATLAHMFKTEGGVRALYRGIVPTVAGVAPYVRTICRSGLVDLCANMQARLASTLWSTSPCGNTLPLKATRTQALFGNWQPELFPELSHRPAHIPCKTNAFSLVPS